MNETITPQHPLHRAKELIAATGNASPVALVMGFIELGLLPADRWIAAVKRFGLYMRIDLAWAKYQELREIATEALHDANTPKGWKVYQQAQAQQDAAWNHWSRLYEQLEALHAESKSKGES